MNENLHDAAALIRDLAGQRIVVVPPSARSGLTPLGGGSVPPKPAGTTPKPPPAMDPAKEAAIARAVTAALQPSRRTTAWEVEVADAIVSALAARRSAPEVNNVVDDGGARLTNAQLDQFAGLFHDAVRMARGENIELSTNEAMKQARGRVIRTDPTSNAERRAVAKQIASEAARLKPIGSR